MWRYQAECEKESLRQAKKWTWKMSGTSAQSSFRKVPTLNSNMLPSKQRMSLFLPFGKVTLQHLCDVSQSRSLTTVYHGACRPFLPVSSSKKGLQRASKGSLFHTDVYALWSPPKFSFIGPPLIFQMVELSKSA
jgi:hypothetical protein